VDDLLAAVDAVSAAPDLGVVCRARYRIRDDAAATVERTPGELVGDGADLRLADRDPDGIARDLVLGAGEGLAGLRTLRREGLTLGRPLAGRSRREPSL
jgi:hypothetical protein